jgi:hypothetical protein
VFHSFHISSGALTMLKTARTAHRNTADEGTAPEPPPAESWQYAQKLYEDYLSFVAMIAHRDDAPAARRPCGG